MLNFFRKIRKQLLSNIKLGGYLIYALGEIVLVVAGILIALKINNWNGEINRINKGQETLLDIKKNIKYNTLQFQKDIDITRELIRSIDILLENIKFIKIYVDSLDVHFRRVSYWSSTR